MVKPAEGSEQYPVINENEALDVCVYLMGKLGVSTLLVSGNDGADREVLKGKIEAMDIVGFYSKRKEIEQRYNGPIRTKRWMVRTRRVLQPKK